MKYLFLVSVGPVQTFIASARRPRDLWFGSWLLSELSKAAARAIVHNRPGNRLIFPAPIDLASLEQGSSFNVANKIVALIDEPPQPLGEVVHTAINTRLENIKTHAFPKEADFDRAVADRQVANLPEYFWAALPYEPDQYAAVRQNLEALLAARKNTRDFQPVLWGSKSPKSSLDGSMESVIPKELYERRRLSTQQQQAHIETLYTTYKAGPAEQLSGVDLLKRLGHAGEQAHFFSTSHIASIPYLMRLTYLDDPTQVQHLLEAYVEKIREIAAQRQLTVMLDTIPGRHNYWEHPILGHYDGSLLFAERLVDIVTDTTGFEPARAILNACYAQIDAALGKARPLQYYAILAADGDRMGMAIDAQTRHANGPERHREISQVLAGFASDAWKIVEKHTGEPVYTGGDDVLAFLPLHSVLACAKELAELFRERLQPFPYAGEHTPTLSVGIAIAHHLDPLRDALNLARSAEKQAKAVDQKNALAIRASKRSGEERSVVGPWGTLDERLSKMMGYYQNGDIPEGLSYELRSQARRLAGPASDYDLLQAREAEAKRIIERKLAIRQKTRSQQSAKETRNLVDALLEMLRGETPSGQKPSDISLLRVEEFATELLVARTLADALELTKPEKKEHHE